MLGGIAKLIRNSISPQVVDSKFITFTAWNIDATGTAYSRATPIDIIDGWKFLVNENIPLDVYAKAFYVKSLYVWLEHNPKKNIQVNSDTDISNILETEPLEILRLCYWINRCKQIIIDKKSFEYKFDEIKCSLCFENELEVDCCPIGGYIRGLGGYSNYTLEKYTDIIIYRYRSNTFEV
jgi:hypothetical protein